MQDETKLELIISFPQGFEILGSEDEVIARTSFPLGLEIYGMKKEVQYCQ